MKIYKLINWHLLLLLFVAFACTDEVVGPVLPDSENFQAPAMTNAATADPKVLTAETASEVFEVFEWTEADYGGISLSTSYVLEADNDEDFSSPFALSEISSATSTEVTNGELNQALLALGLTPNEEGSVYIRVRSTLTGVSSDTLYSPAVTRTATNYKAEQTGGCGNHCTIGLIGSATPGGWDVDTDLRLQDPASDKFTWTTTVYLSAGEVKFRAADDWAVNWGSADFPSGTGAQDGANIPVATAGYYRVTLNDESGEYTFTLLETPTFNTIGVIGSGTAGGWDSDQDLTQDGTDPHVWTGTITLTDGEIKFRANDAWTNNWGAATFPTGYGTHDGPNIPVTAGTYFIRFNDATGEYMLMDPDRSEAYPSVGIIGDATPGGWDADTDLIQNPSNPYLWSKIITLTSASAKFRANDDWAVNWGSADFPSGIGVHDGANIPTEAGTYFVTFNSGTGEYSFLK